MKINYQKKLDALLEQFDADGTAPSLLLHSCCAPCSSYVLEYLGAHMNVTIYYYNPNIYPEAEYTKRVAEQQMLISRLQTKYPVRFIGGNYDPDEFYACIKGTEHIPEGGERCFRCYELRLTQAAEVASEKGFDYFTTTLSISPMKNAEKLNEIGERIGEKYGIRYLPSDFKKRNGYKRSIELSQEHGLYRQDYCGCKFSYRSEETAPV